TGTTSRPAIAPTMPHMGQLSQNEVGHFSVSALVRCMTTPGQRVRRQCPRTLRTLLVTPIKIIYFNNLNVGTRPA
ncbi:hypothetical protein, partial [Xanthomonas oryzae]|uniref:hypothetical protein n=1 Tax=Xanthomonas oryzae TaxID=347 RepID=UPI001C664663